MDEAITYINPLLDRLKSTKIDDKNYEAYISAIQLTFMTEVNNNDILN